jgi:hypothetical protein
VVFIFQKIELFNTDATVMLQGACGSIVVKALCYKLEGRGFDTR